MKLVLSIADKTPGRWLKGKEAWRLINPLAVLPSYPFHALVMEKLKK
jgi:hypothetical protein